MPTDVEFWRPDSTGCLLLQKLLSADFQANLSWHQLNVPPNCFKWRSYKTVIWKLMDFIYLLQYSYLVKLIFHRDLSKLQNKIFMIFKAPTYKNKPKHNMLNWFFGGKSSSFSLSFLEILNCGHTNRYTV